MQEVREEQARRKSEGKTAKQESLKKRRLHSELASYVEEELKLVQDELLSSEEVRSKVKLEMQRAMSSGG